MSESTAYREDIDGLRAFSVLSVLFFHFSFPWFSGGFVGVDVFFVISGYLITSIILADLRKNKFSILQFYERRIRRIFPALFTVLLTTFVVAYFTLMPVDMKDFSRSLAAASGFVANMFFWKTSGYFAAPSEMKPLLHTWSLSVEEQFYILYPAAIILCMRLLPRFLKKLIFLSCLLSFLLSAVTIIRFENANFYLLPLRGWEILLGASIAVGGKQLHSILRLSHGKLEILSLLAGALLLFPTIFYSKATLFPGPLALPPCLGAAIFIWAGIERGNKTWIARILSCKPCVWLGLVSYPLYLWHWPVYTLAKYVLGREGLELWETGCVFVLSIILAVGTYRLIEHPFRMKKIFSTPKSIYAGGGVILAFTLGIGLLGSTTQGFAHRFPEAVAKLCDFPATRLFNKGDMPPDAIIQSGGIPLGAKDRSPDFIVCGDSHAGAVADVLDSLAQKHSISGRLLRVHPPLLGATSLASPEGNNFSALLAYIKQHNIKYILLVARWSIYSEGLEPGEFPEKHIGVPQIMHDGKTVRDLQQARQLVRDAFLKTVDALTRNGVHVVIMREVPRISSHHPCSKLGQMMLWGQDYQNFGVNVTVYRERMAFLDEMFRGLMKKYPGEVTILDPEGYLCQEDGLCRALNKETRQCMWKDDDHVSYYGATTLSPLFESFLSKVSK